MSLTVGAFRQGRTLSEQGAETDLGCVLDLSPIPLVERSAIFVFPLGPGTCLMTAFGGSMPSRYPGIQGRRTGARVEFACQSCNLFTIQDAYLTEQP